MSQLNGQAGDVPSSQQWVSLFALFGPSLDWMGRTHVREGRLLLSPC